MATFPQNVVEALQASLDARMTDHTVVMRGLRPSDPNLSVGVFAEEWDPVQGSTEMPSVEPTLHRYTFKIQNMCVSLDEAKGRADFSVNGKIIRAILYRDPTLHATLLGLQEELLDTRESVRRFGVTRQKFMVGQAKGKWTYLATTEFWVETEVIPQ